MKFAHLNIFFVAISALFFSAVIHSVCLANITNHFTRSPKSIFFKSDSQVFLVTINIYYTKCGYREGGIAINVANGVPPYQYKINTSPYWRSNGVFGNLSTGNYRIYVKDAASVIDSMDVSITNTFQPPTLTSSITNANVFLCDDTYQNYSLIASGGTPPYLFTYDFVNMQSSPVFNNLSKGDYNWAVKDANGCVAMLNTNIDATNCLFGYSGGGSQNNCDPNAMTADLQAVHFSASSINNCLVSANGGPYQDIAYAYGPGLHVFDIIDTATGATTKYVRSVLNYCRLELNAKMTKAGCNGENGSVKLTAKNGTPPYLYSDDGFNFSPLDSFSNIKAGIYTYVVKDADEKVAFVQVEILADCPRVAANVTPTNCGLSNGSIVASGYGGLLPYTYSIDGLNFQSSNEFAGLASGSYTVTLKDAGGFKDSTSLTVFSGACLSIALSTTNGSCGVPGSISVTASGGLAPYSYSIDSITFQTSNIFLNLSAGNYVVYVRDGFGVVVTVHDTIRTSLNPRFTLGTDTTICKGESVNLGPDVLYPGSTIEWSTGENSSFISVSTTGNYSLRVTTLEGCVWSDTVLVNVNALPTFNLGDDTAICEGDSIILDAAFSSGSGYLWSDNSTLPNLVVRGANLYWCEIVKDGCAYRDSLQLNVKPNPIVNLGRDTSLCEGAALQLNVYYDGAGYLWQDNSTLSQYEIKQGGIYTVAVNKDGCIARDTIKVQFILRPRFTLGEDRFICSGQTVILSPSTNPMWQLRWQDGSIGTSFSVALAGRYSLEATNGCGTTIDEVFFTEGLCNIYIPSAFSPNSDGKNDEFKVSGTSLVVDFHLQIFNRFGQLLFESTDKNKGWNGQYKGEPVEGGAYVYMLWYKNNNRLQSRSGSFLLLR